MKIPVLVNKLATSRIGLIWPSGYMMNELLLRNNKYLRLFQWKINQVKRPRRVKIFLLTMGFLPPPPRFYVYTRKLPPHAPDLKESANPNPIGEDLGLRGMKTNNYELRERGKKWHKRSQNREQEWKVILIRSRLRYLQAELTQHRIPRKWKPQY